MSDLSKVSKRRETLKHLQWATSLETSTLVRKAWSEAESQMQFVTDHTRKLLITTFTKPIKHVKCSLFMP